MKKIFYVLCIVIGFFSGEISGLLTKFEDVTRISAIYKSTVEVHQSFVFMQERSVENLPVIIELAKENNTNLFVFVSNNATIEEEKADIYAYFSDDRYLETYPIVPKMNKEQFNEYTSMIGKGTSEYALNISSDTYHLVPFLMLEEVIIQLEVTAKNVQELLHFSEALNTMGYEHLVYEQNMETIQPSNIKLLLYAINQNTIIIVGSIILLFILLFYGLKERYNHACLKLQGVSTQRIIMRIILYFTLPMFLCLAIGSILYGIVYDLLSFSYLLNSVLSLSIVVVIQLIGLLLLVFTINQMNIIRELKYEKNHRLYLGFGMLLKITMIIVLANPFTQSVTTLQSLVKEIQIYENHKETYKDILQLQQVNPTSYFLNFSEYYTKIREDYEILYVLPLERNGYHYYIVNEEYLNYVGIDLGSEDTIYVSKDLEKEIGKLIEEPDSFACIVLLDQCENKEVKGVDTGFPIVDFYEDEVVTSFIVEVKEASYVPDLYLLTKDSSKPVQAVIDQSIGSNIVRVVAFEELYKGKDNCYINSSNKHHFHY